MTTLATFEPLIHSRSLLRHPFYLRWSAGELTVDELRVYAKEYFHLVKAIPEIVFAIAEQVQDDDLKARIEQNAREEAEHVELWRRFAHSLEISDSELDAYQPSETVMQAVQVLRDVCARSVEQGIAAMYALEMELPDIARTKKEGLTEFYGLTSEDAHIYFDEHLKEEAHLVVWRAFPLQEDVTAAVQRSLDAQNNVLNGVCETANISLVC